MCSCSKKLCIQLLMIILLVINTIVQFVGLVLTAWGCEIGPNEICEFEGLFNHCWNGTCTDSVRYNGLATLATTSFTLSFVSCLICLSLMWAYCTGNDDTNTALREGRSVWWKWIAIFSILSYITAAVVFLTGMWQYGRVASGFLTFSVPGLALTGGMFVALMIYLLYNQYLCQFVAFISLNDAYIH